MLDSYKKALEFLEEFIPAQRNLYPGIKGLERMKYLVYLLGNPHESYKTIHVGGTSGKGSTSTIIASILGRKYRTGLYTSPHLVSVNERMKIIENIRNGKEKIKFRDINNGDFIDLINIISPVIEKMKRSKWGSPSFFEIITASAFLYFKMKKVEYAVIEVGLGGKYDATNIINPQVAVLTNVGLDHTDVLGKTVEKIAKDKVGIIKHKINVVSGINQKSVIEILEQECRRKGTQFFIMNRNFCFHVHKMNASGTRFDYLNDQSIKNIRIKLLGKHQVKNAVLAIKSVQLLQDPGIKINNIRDALREVFIEARLEKIDSSPLVILDGAHNIGKIKALVSAVRKIWPNKLVKTVLAIKKDKDAKVMTRKLLEISEHFILTQYNLKIDYGNISSQEPELLEKIIHDKDKSIHTKIIRDPIEAYKYAINISDKKDIILVTGSLYLIGVLKENKYGKS